MENFSLIVCGVEKTGQVVIFNRAALYRKEVEQPVLPRERLQVSKEGTSVTSLDIQEELLVTGTSDGSVCLYNLQTGRMMERLAQGGSLVYQVKLGAGKVVATAGSKITVHTITRQESGSGITTSLSHLLTGHSREVLCLALTGNVVVSGGQDNKVLVTKLGPPHQSQLLHSLEHHKLRVRCVAVEGRHAVSGSWDRTAVLWDIITGAALRVIKHEMQVRSVSLDSQRIVTGDMEGFVFAWDLANCLDPQCGSEKLCLRYGLASRNY